MGEQVAVETYLRAMVNEHDECEVRMTGSDQGFHNVSIPTICQDEALYYNTADKKSTLAVPLL